MFKTVLPYCYSILAVFVISLSHKVYAGDETLTGVIKCPSSREIPAAAPCIDDQRWVVELFNLEGNDYAVAHSRLDWMNKIYPTLSDFTGFLVAQNDSKRVRGLIGPFKTKREAEWYATGLRAIFVPDQPRCLAAEVIYRTCFTPEKVERHPWKK